MGKTKKYKNREAESTGSTDIEPTVVSSQSSQSEVVDYLQKSGSSKPWLKTKDTSNPFKNQRYQSNSFSNNNRPSNRFPEEASHSTNPFRNSAPPRKSIVIPKPTPSKWESYDNLDDNDKNYTRKVLTKFATIGSIPPNLEKAMELLARKADKRERIEKLKAGVPIEIVDEEQRTQGYEEKLKKNQIRKSKQR